MDPIIQSGKLQNQGYILKFISKLQAFETLLEKIIFVKVKPLVSKMTSQGYQVVRKK